MHRHHSAIFLESARSDSSELLHVRTATKQVTEVHTKCSHVCTSLARKPKDAKVAFVVVLDETGLIDCANTKLFLDGRD